MIVDSVSTNPQEGNQNLGLTLIDRVASSDFARRFPQGTPVAEVLDYAREHSIDWLSAPYSSFAHKRNLLVNGTNHHLGDVITEQKAFDLGYVEPHIDTVAGRIVDTVVNLPVRDNQRITQALRETELITPDYSAILLPGRLHVFDNTEAQRLGRNPIHDDANHTMHNKSHPIDLMIFSPKDGVRPVGVLGFYVPQKNTVFEFMTYVPEK